MNDWDQLAPDHPVADGVAPHDGAVAPLDGAVDDAVLARGMYSEDGGLTAAGWQRLERWSQEYDAEVRDITRRWGRVVLTIDVIGLPVMLLLTSWPWALVAWLVVVVALVGLGATACHRARESRTRRFVQRQLRLRSLAGLVTPTEPTGSITGSMTGSITGSIAGSITALTTGLTTGPAHAEPAVITGATNGARLVS